MCYNTFVPNHKEWANFAVDKIEKWSTVCMQVWAMEVSHYIDKNIRLLRSFDDKISVILLK